MSKRAFLVALFASTAMTCAESPPTAAPSPPDMMHPTGPLVSDKGASVYGGGCYPAALAGGGGAAQLTDLATINPHWAPVVNGASPDSDPVYVHGIARGSHGDTGGDFPADHVTSDATVAIEPDESDRWLVASGNPGNSIELEWEAGSYPDWARAGEGDRIVAFGRWIFDCGHTGDMPGACSQSAAQKCTLDSDCQAPSCKTCTSGETCAGAHFNYSSEIHPPQASAVMRSGRGGIVSDEPGAKATLATRADVWVSPDGGGAGDRCLMTHLDRIDDLFISSDCYPLADPLAKINAQDFLFDLPLPARPPGAVPSYRVVPRDPHGGIAAAVEITAHADDPSPHLGVRVKMTEKTAMGLPTGYAATILAGWKAPPPAPLTHVRVSILGVVIVNPVKPRVPVVREARGWKLQAIVNGEMQTLGNLDLVNAAATIPESVAFDQYLPPDGQVTLLVNGTSNQCIDTLFGTALPTSLRALGTGNLIDCLRTNNDPHQPGVVRATYPAPDFGGPGGLGMKEYTTPSTGADGGSCAESGDPCLTDKDCAMAEACKPTGTAFSLRYRIETLP